MASERILVRLPGAKLGDFLMTTPLLAGLRAAHPAAEITLLLWPPPPGAWLGPNPLFAETLWDDQQGRYAGLRGRQRLLAEIRRRRFDAAITLHSGARYAWLFQQARIPIRIGSTGKYYGALFTHNLPQGRGTPDRHEVEFNYDMGRPLGVIGEPGPMFYPVSAADEAEAERLLAEGGVSDQERLLLLNPTHGGSSRAWPAERFLETARRLAEATGARLGITGVRQDVEDNAQLARALAPTALDLTGRTSVGVLAALFRRTALHLSVDTGTAHLAAAMGTPCVTVFPFFEHWDQRRRWQPWRTAARIVGPTLRCPACRPGGCTRTQSVCVESVSVEAVVAAGLDLWNAEGLEGHKEAQKAQERLRFGAGEWR